MKTIVFILFQRDFISSYKKIINKNKKIILCGGTGLYIESLLLDYDLSNSPPRYKSKA